MLTRSYTSDKVQWLLLWCIALGKYAETACILLILVFCGRKYKCFKPLLVITLLFSHFVIADLVTNYPTDKFWQQFIVIGLYLVGYYQFFHNYVPSIPKLWEKYVRFSLWLCYIGYVQFAIYAATGIDYIGGLFSQQEMIDGRTRMTSVFLEPGNFAAFIVPAIVTCFLDKENRILKQKEKYALIIALLLSFTTIGYLMLIVILAYSYRKIIMKYIWVFVVPIVVFAGFLINYSATGEKVGFELIDGMLEKFSNSFNMLSNVSLNGLALVGDASTYAIFSNLYVAQEAPLRFMGTGLGTHEISYFSVYRDTNNYNYGLNSTDAYSLFTRIFSEFGYLGVACLAYILYKNFNRKSLINISLLFYFISLLIRGGFYFLYGVIFFFYLYYYTSGRSCLYKFKKRTLQ